MPLFSNTPLRFTSCTFIGPMLSIPLFRITFLRSLQSANASYSIRRSLSGALNEVSPLHWNALCPIVCNLLFSSNVISINCLHHLNAPSSIYFNADGNVIFRRADLVKQNFFSVLVASPSSTECMRWLSGNAASYTVTRLFDIANVLVSPCSD